MNKREGFQKCYKVGEVLPEGGRCCNNKPPDCRRVCGGNYKVNIKGNCTLGGGNIKSGRPPKPIVTNPLPPGTRKCTPEIHEHNKNNKNKIPCFSGQ